MTDLERTVVVVLIVLLLGPFHIGLLLGKSAVVADVVLVDTTPAEGTVFTEVFEVIWRWIYGKSAVPPNHNHLLLQARA